MNGRRWRRQFCSSRRLQSEKSNYRTENRTVIVMRRVAKANELCGGNGGKHHKIEIESNE